MEVPFPRGATLVAGSEIRNYQHFKIWIFALDFSPRELTWPYHILNNVRRYSFEEFAFAWSRQISHVRSHLPVLTKKTINVVLANARKEKLFDTSNTRIILYFSLFLKSCYFCIQQMSDSVEKLGFWRIETKLDPEIVLLRLQFLNMEKSQWESVFYKRKAWIEPGSQFSNKHWHQKFK